MTETSIWKIIFLLFTALILPMNSQANQYYLQIHFLDVGQGDAMILHQPGSCTVLIDAGPLINGHRVTEKLKELGVSVLDLVIITHPHLDHFGGLFDIAPRVTIKKLFDNGLDNPVKEYFDDYQAVRNTHPYEILTAGNQLSCGDLKITILHPGKTNNINEDLNTNSLVLMIVYKNFRLLSMGDLAGTAESAFLEQENDLKADVLKLAHHGAVDATSEKLLEAAKPDTALISTADSNSINSPSEQILQRLFKHGVSFYRTDRDQTITILVSGQGYTISTHREGPPP